MSRIRSLTTIAVILSFSFSLEGSESKGVHRSDPLTEIVPIEASACLFRQVDPQDSGVVFKNEYSHPERWRKLWHQYFLGTIGTGVALGDFDGDGLPDIFAVGKDSPNALFLNRGDFRFEDVTSASGLAGGEGIGAGATAVDIDNDGDLDIFVTYTGFANELYINDGTGVFIEQGERWGLATVTGSNAPSFADFDRDGDLDLYLQCNFLMESGLAEGMPDLLFENLGDRFVEVTERAGISGNGQGHAAIWWDFDEDDWPDIYVANDFEPADRLYRNNRDGTFTDVIGEVLISAPYSAMGADLGDINNDGHVDFIVAEMAARDHVKAHRTVLSIGTKLVRAPRSTVSQYMKNMCSLKIGPNQFAEISYLNGLEATDWTWAARLNDLDNDGLIDAFFTNGMVRAFHDADLGLKSKQAKSGWQRLAYFKASPQYDEQNLAYRNLGDYQFVDTSERWGLDMVGVSFAAAFADFDGDGDLDIVLSNMEKNLTLYRNNSEEGARAMFRLVGSESNRFGVGAKVKLFAGSEVFVRELSLTRGYLSSDEPLLHFGLGGHGSIDRLEIRWPSGAFQVLENLPVNRTFRIEEADSETEAKKEAPPLFVRSEIKVPNSSVSEEEHLQMFPMQMLIPSVDTRLGPEIVVADFDNDGWTDVALGGATGQETRLFRNVGGKELQLVRMGAFDDDYDSEDSALLVFDFDGDGSSDLYASSGSFELDEGDVYYKDRIYLNDGRGALERLKESSFPAGRRSSGAAAFIDYDQDGDLDLIVAGGTKRESYPAHEDNLVWRRDDKGFVLDSESDFAKAFLETGNTSRLLVCDWNGDGRNDLVQTVRWGPPALWANSEKGLIRDDAALDYDRLKGVWKSVACGDFNRDGRLDLVLGNYGLNTKYRPKPDEPLVLFSSTQEHLSNTYIEGYTVEGRLLPVDSRMLHEIQFPGLMEKTTSSIADYAEKSIQEIFPEELLSKYDRFELNEVRSILLLQNEDGGFDVAELPRWAQSGAVIDILVADVDSDGWEDMILVHEMLPPNPWAERFLKGHVSLLINRHGGGFNALLPFKSGLEVDGYPRRLAWSDLDNDGLSELLVSMNEGPLLVFKLQR